MDLSLVQEGVLLFAQLHAAGLAVGRSRHPLRRLCRRGVPPQPPAAATRVRLSRLYAAAAAALLLFGCVSHSFFLVAVSACTDIDMCSCAEADAQAASSVRIAGDDGAGSVAPQARARQLRAERAASGSRRAGPARLSVDQRGGAAPLSHIRQHVLLLVVVNRAEPADHRSAAAGLRP